MTVIMRCDECNEVIFRGVEFDKHGGLETDIDGDYLPGCGRCEECGRELCYSCGDVQDSLCESCREELGREETLVEGEKITVL